MSLSGVPSRGPREQPAAGAALRKQSSLRSERSGCSPPPPPPPPLPPVQSGHVSSIPPVLTGHVSPLSPRQSERSGCSSEQLPSGSALRKQTSVRSEKSVTLQEPLSGSERTSPSGRPLSARAAAPRLSKTPSMTLLRRVKGMAAVRSMRESLAGVFGLLGTPKRGGSDASAPRFKSRHKQLLLQELPNGGKVGDALIDVFKEMDVDSSGGIDQEELRTGLEKLGFEVSDELLTSMMEDADKDRSGTIEVEEFVVFMAALRVKEDMAAALVDRWDGRPSSRATSAAASRTASAAAAAARSASGESSKSAGSADGPGAGGLARNASATSFVSSASDYPLSVAASEETEAAPAAPAAPSFLRPPQEEYVRFKACTYHNKQTGTTPPPPSLPYKVHTSRPSLPY